jgi:hypothetical protein
VPPSGLVGGTDYCALSTAAMVAATTGAGACISCAASTGLPSSCAEQCPACVNALDAYVASCTGVLADIQAEQYVTYASLMSYAGALAATNDCQNLFNAAARAFAEAQCSSAFDHVALYLQSADNPSVVLSEEGLMVTPYACLSANSASCPAECQADLDLLASACRAEDRVAWAGAGLPGYLTASGAPEGVDVSPHDAWALFVNGTAPVPANLRSGVKYPGEKPLDLSACVLPVDTNGDFAHYSPPPPGPPPPGPPPPGPALAQLPPSPMTAGATTYIVSASATLGGFTSASFGTPEQATFVSVLASMLQTPLSAVAVTSVADAPGRRHLSADSVTVSFSVTTTSPEGVLSGVTSLSADASAFASALVAAGLSVTGVSVTAPTQAIQPLSTAQMVVDAAVASLDDGAATVYRFDQLSNLSSVVASIATPLALEQVAEYVAALVSNAAQINATSSAIALDILASVALRGALVTPAAANAVVAGLSFIATAALSPSNDVGLGVLRTVLDIVDELARSLQAPMAPDAPPIEVYSPTIQLRVQVNLPTADSPLFTARLTAAGSASSFSPMPADLFAGVAGASAGVATLFASFTFDPYAATVDPDSTGITRLAFSMGAGSSAKEILVANLRTPIQFKLPALTKLTSGAKATCQFWDKAAQPPAYSTTGCVGIPDPQPRNHSLTLKPGFAASSDADMATMWDIAGPLVDGNCTAQVLDCGLVALGRDPKVYPNPALAFGTGTALNCSADNLTPKLIWVGSRCRLTQADNELACAWDNNLQAFIGAGCVASGAPVQCACRHVRAAPLLRALAPRSV